MAFLANLFCKDTIILLKSQDKGKLFGYTKKRAKCILCPLFIG